jgi:hypothetical protein
VLLGALRRYGREVGPALEEIQRSSLDARERAEAVPGRIPRPERGATARLRNSG